MSIFKQDINKTLIIDHLYRDWLAGENPGLDINMIFSDYHIELNDDLTILRISKKSTSNCAHFIDILLRQLKSVIPSLQIIETDGLSINITDYTIENIGIRDLQKSEFQYAYNCEKFKNVCINTFSMHSCVKYDDDKLILPELENSFITSKFAYFKIRDGFQNFDLDKILSQFYNGPQFIQSDEYHKIPIRIPIQITENMFNVFINLQSYLAESNIDSLSIDLGNLSHINFSRHPEKLSDYKCMTRVHGYYAAIRLYV